jgi:hypothetical protein
VNDKASTLGTLIGELTILLSPIADLTPQRSHLVLRELGIPITPQQATTLGAAFGQMTGAIGALIDIGPALELSVGAGKVSLSGQAMSRIAELISGMSAIADAVDDLQVPGVAPADIAALPGRLLGWLIANYLGRSAGVNELLQIAGILKRTDHNVGSHDPATPFYTENSFDFGRIGGWLSNPGNQLADLYDWGKPTFGPKLLSLVDEIVGMLGLPTLYDPTAAHPVLDLLFAQLSVHPGPGVGHGLALHLRDGVGKGSFEVGATNFALTLSSDFEVPGGTELVMTPGGMSVRFPDAAQPTGRMSVDLAYERPSASLPLLSVEGGQMSARKVSATAAIDVHSVAGVPTAAYSIGITFAGGKVVIDIEAASALLAGLVGIDKVQSDFDLALDYSLDRGLRFGADTHLQKRLASDIALGPVTIDELNIDVGIDGAKFQVGVLADLRASLGPLSVTATGLGVVTILSFPPQSKGNLGPLDFAFDFKAPTGIGLALDAGPVSGGGYLSIDPTGQRYGGVLQLKMPIASVVAFGIYEQVQDQASFVAVLGIRFNPGVQLSFGFALTGIGGLVGLNRRANVDVLRDRLASGAAGNVLFCEDPVKNAPTILGDLAAFFPAASNGFLVGPTLQISWLSPIVRLDIGILIEFPGPSKIVILGSIRAMLGLDETLALLYLRMDVLGIIDFEQQLISIDAALVNSNALGIVRLTGGMAFRLSYGNNPYILLSVGGFHPRFDPGPLNIPRLARIGASLDISVVVNIYIRVELYVAFTSNTLQTGSRVEAGMDIGPLGVHGYFSFDALIQFKPFYFDLEYSAGFAVEVFGASFCSVSIVGRISGPGPIVIYARGSVKLLFVRVSASATFELGENNGDTLTPIASPVHELAPELRELSNLRTEGEDPAIVRRPGRPVVQGVLVSPKGSLIWEQKRAPLKTIIDRLGGVPLTGQHELHLDMPAGWTTSDEQDWFNPGSFTNLDLKASQSLNNATFQELTSGLKIGSAADAHAEAVVDYLDEIDLVKRPEKTRFEDLVAGAYLTNNLHAMLVERTTTPPVEPGPPKVVVKAETADVHAADGTLLQQELAPFQAFQFSRQNVGRIAVPTTDLTVDL